VKLRGKKFESPCKAASEFYLNRPLEIKFLGGRHYSKLITSMSFPISLIYNGDLILFLIINLKTVAS
jgi:hypothetical protein